MAGAAVLGLCSEVEAISAFTLEDFTGRDSTVVGSISQNGNALNFLLKITKPASPSDSDLTGFWGHIADESLVSGLVVANVKFNGVVSLSYQFAKSVNGVGSVGFPGNNLNGGNLGLFDFGFFFGASRGLDPQPINEVSFTLSGTSPLTEGLFVNQLFGARLQPLEAVSSSKLSGTTTTVSVPEGGSTFVMFALVLGGLAAFRHRFSFTRWHASHRRSSNPDPASAYI